MFSFRSRGAGAAFGCACFVVLVPVAGFATVDTLVQGVVFAEGDQPAAGATVVLHDADGQTVARAATGPDGSYRFHVALGDYTVEASLPGHLDGHQHIHVSSTEPATANVYLGLARYSSHVRETMPEAPPPSRATGSVQTLGREQLKALPKGEDLPITDVLATQPGFVLDAFGNVYARGNHANIQYQLDGVPIPDSVGNLFAQTLPVRLIQDLEILTGGMPAEFGDRLAAVVNITSRQGGLVPEGTAQVRYGSFQTVEPSATYARSFLDGKLGVFVGGSYLYSQRALDPPSIVPILHDDGQTGRLFLRLDFRPSEKDRFEVFASYAYNRFQIPIDPTVVPLDPTRPDLVRPVDQYGNSSPPFVPHDTDATETEHEVFVTGSWVHTFSPSATLQIAPYYKLSYGALASDPAHALGPLADPGSTASDVTRRAEHLGAIASGSLHVGNHLLKAGAQVDYLLGRTDFTDYVRDDTSPAAGPDPSQTSRGVDTTSSLLAGAYVEDRWVRGRLSVDMGVRVDALHVALASGASSDAAGVSPRLGASLLLHPAVTAHAFVGLLWQPPAPLDAANAARLLGVIPANMTVPYDVVPETDLYGELGVDVRPLKQLRVGAVGWSRYAWNQLDDVAIGATNLIANYNFQEGRAVGVEGRADLVLGRYLTAFANVSWEIAQGRGIASAKYLFTTDQIASTVWQTLDHTQTLTANVGATLHGKGAALTLLGTYGSGLRTGPDNTVTVPEHYRLDATLSYVFAELPLHPQVAVDLINLFDAHYAYRIANGFVGSSYAPPRSVYVRLAIPLGGF